MSPVLPPLVKSFKKGTQAVLDVLFPRNCLACNGLVSEGLYRYLCPTCARRIEIIQPPCCESCGINFEGDVQGTRLCPHCYELTPAFSCGRTGFRLSGVGRQLIHTLKYKQGSYLLPDIQRLVCTPLGYLEFLEGAILVPVPLHPRKERERGFNQSQLIAEWIGRSCQGVSISNCLSRKRDTPSQTKLSRQKRQANVRGAFMLKKGASIDTKSRYVVVDDVFTTGATLNECCKVLRSQGALRVDVLTLGHG